MSNADTVATWFREKLAGGPLARDTPAYNQVVEALPDLVARLDPPAAPQPAQPEPAPAQPEPAPAQPEPAPAQPEPQPEPQAEPHPAQEGQ